MFEIILVHKPNNKKKKFLLLQVPEVSVVWAVSEAQVDSIQAKEVLTYNELHKYKMGFLLSRFKKML